jgi:hypothetical protein
MGLLVAGASAEDAPKKEKSASAPTRYEPLPDAKGASTPAVPEPQKELPEDREKDSGGPVGIGASSQVGVTLPPDADKDPKKQQLWIYTLPEEQAVREQEHLQEMRRLEQWEETQKARQLPDWAGDP